MTATAEIVDQPAQQGRGRPDEQWQRSGLFTQIWALTARSLHPYRRPGMVVTTLIEPLIMLLLFGGAFQVLGSAPGMPVGVAYIDTLLPAILVITALAGGVQSGNALVNDLRNDVITRFRAMPIRMVSVLVARSFADSTRVLGELVVIEVLGLLIFGFNPPGGILGALGALLVAGLVGWSISWIFIALAATLRNGEILRVMTAALTFPLMFASNSFVPSESMPVWLRVVADVNPVSYANITARHIAIGQVNLLELLLTVGLCLGVVAVAAPLANRAFKRL